MLKLYNTSSEDPGKIQCVFTLPKKLRSRTFVDIYSGDSHHHHASTFYTRPEDRILVVSVKETPLSDSPPHHTHATSIVVFISTLLRLAQSHHLVVWEKWKQYTWMADNQEADNLVNDKTFISSSRIINFNASPEQDGMMTLEVTNFRPSIIERSLYTSDDAPEESGCAEPSGLIGRKRLLDVQAADLDRTEVMMSEDNIVLMTRVRNAPGGDLHGRQLDGTSERLDGGSETGCELTVLTF